MKRNPILDLIFPISGIDKEAKNDYSSTINTNTFNQLNEIKINDYSIDPITGTANFQHKNTTLSVLNFKSISPSGLSTTARYLLNALIIEFNLGGRKSEMIILPVKKYMELRGLTDKKEAIKQITKDLKVLHSCYISYQKEQNKNKKKCDENFRDISLCQEVGIDSGNIFFHLSKFFYNHLSDAYIMPINANSFKFNTRTSSFFLDHRLHTHFNMNCQKSNAHIIAVKTLLSSCPTIPKKEKAYPYLSQRIIEPFERDMDALTPSIVWEYCNEKGSSLTDKQCNKLNYEAFIKLNVKFSINEHPLKDVTKKKRPYKKKVKK